MNFIAHCDNKRAQVVVFRLLIWMSVNVFFGICNAAPDSPHIVFIVADDLVCNDVLSKKCEVNQWC